MMWHQFLPKDHRLSGLRDACATDVDPRLFTEGKRYSGNACLQISVERGGQPLDFTFGSFDLPVMRSMLGESIQRVAPTEIQLIPVCINGGGVYQILNVLTVLNAINEDLSQITRWTNEDGRPEKIGNYFAIGHLVLNKTNIMDSKIFRLKGWELPLIVCETIKQIIEDFNVTGVSFKELKVV